MRVTLTLQPDPKAEASAVSAGWLPSDDSAVWLSELAACQRQGRPVLAFAVAKSVENPECAGAFLVPEVGNVPRFGSRVHPFYEALEKVHVPIGAVLSAGVLEHEKSHFFPHRFHFFHPVLGAVGFDKEHAVSPTSLIVVPPRSEVEWDAAVPGPRTIPALSGFSVAVPESPDGFLDEAGGDISSLKGKKPKKGSGLLDKLGAIGAGLAGGAILGLQGITSALPFSSRSSLGGSALSQEKSDQFLEWARRNWENLLDKRKREIDKLLQKLEKDPDEGLKYALPLVGSESARGTAPPSTRLGLRNMRFNLGGGSGGPVDAWDLSYEHRLALEQKYRDAAAREIAKGNHERAAYILGNLVGDWNGAAQVLADAGRHRDAVAIYLHKTKNKKAAAKCFEDCGMFQQAADLYREIGELEKAGDLVAKLGNREEARQLWIRAADDQNDLLQKARIWSEKLGSDAVALEILDQAWPLGNRSESILRRMFQILEEHKQVETAQALAGRVLNRGEDVQGLKLEIKLELLHSVARKWRDEKLSDFVEGEMWKRIAVEVTAQAKNSENLLNLIPRLAPRDRLLERDVKRYNRKGANFSTGVSKAYSGQIPVIEIVTLPGQSEWLSMCNIGSGLSLVAVCAETVLLCEWKNGVCETIRSQIHVGASDGPGIDHLRPGNRPDSPVIFHFAAAMKVSYFKRRSCFANGQLETLENIVAIGPEQPNGYTAILEYTNAQSLVAHFFDKNSELRSAIPIDVATPAVLGARWHIASSNKVMCFAADGFFARREPDGSFATVGLAGVPSSLEISEKDENAALVVVGLEVLYIYKERAGQPIETVNLSPAVQSESPPVATFLPDGSIAIAWRGGGEIYSPGRFLTPAARFSFPTKAGEPVAVTSYGANGIAVLTKEGHLVRL